MFMISPDTKATFDQIILENFTTHGFWFLHGSVMQFSVIRSIVLVLIWRKEVMSEIKYN